jgi:hypothetical protein
MSVLNPTLQTTYPAHHVMTRTAQVQLQPSVNTSAYTANFCVGGKLVFANIAGPQQSGVIQNVTVTCKTTQTTGYKLYIFTGNPGRTTIADFATPTINANNDLQYLMDVITLGSADSTLTSTINVTDNIGRAFVSQDQNLYGILLTNATPTYTTTRDVIITMTVLQD